MRVPPYNDVLINFTVPAQYTVETHFVATVTDMADLSTSTQEFDGVAGDTLAVSVDGKYDSDYHIVILDDQDDRVVDAGYELRRPYVDPTTKGTTASEVAKYADHEELARAVIDSVIPSGFYYKKKTVETVGLGADYIPIWEDAKKVLAVYENNVLVTDRQFKITADKTAVYEVFADAINRDESAYIMIPSAASDMVDIDFSYRGFPKSWDYRMVLEVGYPEVPSDIVRATELLINDIDCGKLDYYKRYISAYNTDQFRIQFDKGVFEGTGNLIVDKILSKYHKTISKIGVL